MEEYVNNFLEDLWYVEYLKKERVKVQSFLSGLAQHYRDRIEFFDPQNLRNSSEWRSIAMKMERERKNATHGER